MGVLYNKEDDSSLKEGIRKMLEDQLYYEQAKESARKRSRYFNGELMAKRVEGEVLTLVNENKVV